MNMPDDYTGDVWTTKRSSVQRDEERATPESTTPIIDDATRVARILRLVFGCGRPPTRNHWLLYAYHLLTGAIVIYLLVECACLIRHLTSIGLSVNYQTAMAFGMFCWYVQILASIVVSLRYEYCSAALLRNAWTHAEADRFFSAAQRRRLSHMTSGSAAASIVCVAGAFVLKLFVTLYTKGGTEKISQLYFPGRANIVPAILCIFHDAPYWLMQALYVSIVLTVKYALRGFRQEVRGASNIGAQLREWSATYSRLVSLLNEANDALHCYGAISIVTTMPSIILDLFVQFADIDTEDGAAKVLAIIWCFSKILLMAIICSASTCNKELGLLFDELNRRLGDAAAVFNNQNQVDAALLLQQMSMCRNAGITLWDFYVIRSSMIVTLSSIIVTYLIILVQFTIEN